jgi:hypothetical protein
LSVAREFAILQKVFEIKKFLKNKGGCSMKKVLLTALFLGLVAVGVTGCAKEETPVQIESAAVVETPSPVAEKVAVAVDSAASAVLDATTGPEAKAVAANVTSAVQASSQAAARETGMIVSGVMASTQTDTQDSVRATSAVVGGVTSAAQASSQASALKEDVTVAKEEMPSETLPAVS